MANSPYLSVSGSVLNIRPVNNQCCQQIVSVLTQNGPVSLMISSDTFVVNSIRLLPGMRIIAFYNANAPAPLIFPPQYRADVIALQVPGETIVLDYFGADLVNSSRTLKLNIASSTEITTANGQMYPCNLRNQLLLVYYSASTRSIPAQATPRRIIVMC